MADSRQEILDRFLAEQQGGGGGQQAPQPQQPQDTAPAGDATAATTEPVDAGGAEQGGDAPADPRQAILDDFIEKQREQSVRADVANETERALDRSRINVDVAPADTWLGWTARVGRSASFGASDAVNALILQYQLKDEVPDLTYSETLDAVREGFEEDESLTAELAGFLVPGAGIAKGLAAAGRGIAKSGMVDGALRWAAKNPKTARIAAASGAGTAGGATEEAIRTSVEETVDLSGGDVFEADKIIDATIRGATVGALLTPAADQAMSGAKGVFGWLKGMAGSTDEQTLQATRRIAKTVARENETPDDAITRLRGDAARFKENNGYTPSLADLLPPEKVRDISDVVRYFNGLDIRSRELAEGGVERAVGAFRRAVDSGAPLKSPEQIRAQAEDLFSGMMRQHGNTPVNVPEETMEVLSRNRGWVANQAKTNDSAREIARVIDARDSISAFRQKAAQLSEAKNIKEAQSEVAELRRHIAELMDGEFQEGAVEASELAQLRNLANLLDARTKAMSADSAARKAEFDVESFRPTLRAAEKVLDDYSRNGLRINLSDANSMRALASKWAFSPQATLAEGQTARAVRDAVADVGKDEVPQYGEVVRLWRDGMTRAEAQATGEAAAAGNIDLRDLGVRIRKARPAKGPRARGSAATSMQRGIREGAVREVSNEAQGTTREAVTAAKRISDSPRVREGLEMAAPGDAGRITRSAEQVGETTEQMRSLANPTSPSAIAEEVQETRELALSGAFGNLGGAGRAALMMRLLMRARLPRGTAQKLVDMLGDPDRLDEALTFMAKEGIDLGAFFGAVSGGVSGLEPE